MSRKQRSKKHQERQQQQQRTLLIGAGLVLVVVILVGGGIAIAVNRDAQLAANATATQQQAEATATQEALAAMTQQAPTTATQPVLAEGPEPTLIPLGEEARWTAPPEMTIDPEKTDYRAVLKTEKGDIVVDLFEDLAPITVNNFVFLAREGFYDNTMFHRVLDGFMAQGGDPTGTGMGGPGYQFEDETDNGLVFDRAGLLAMANSGTDTNGSQFFITYVPTEYLNGLHTIFGEVIEGMDMAESLTRRDPDQNPTFNGDTLLTVEIIEEPKTAGE
ncbi:MAG: peptidylprolyl isomerase [Anaerolineae bacterium]|nr:peptidylprolyl isomerase [Anaerolineae bacterium]